MSCIKSGRQCHKYNDVKNCQDRQAMKVVRKKRGKKEWGEGKKTSRNVKNEEIICVVMIPIPGRLPFGNKSVSLLFNSANCRLMYL